jgi:DNA-binding NarL/FixJ family response regulator
MTLTLLWGLAFKLLLPLLVLIAVVDVLTQTQPQRIRRLSCAGWSQRRIAERLNLSRYRVRQALA